jgi:predicted RecB family nuclease
MQKLYPEVISETELEAFFDHPNTIDLFGIVNKHTDWPVSSYSLKDLAQYLGYKWRDETPSGALSIEWFNKFIDTQDTEILNRLLAYNEDDCKATMVLKRGIEKLVNAKI